MIENKIDREIDSLKCFMSKIGDIKKMIYEPNIEEKEQYNILFRKFIATNASNTSDREKGKALENLVYQTIKNTHLYKCYKNIRTSSNEIDVFFEANDSAIYFMQQGHISEIPRKLLGECKNYKNRIAVTFIGKFYSLMIASNIQYGIMFSLNGITGKGEWDSGKGLIKKLYMSKENECDKLYILSFDLKDFKRINDGEYFLEIFFEKIKSLQLDTSFEKYISKHSAEDLI